MRDRPTRHRDGCTRTKVPAHDTEQRAQPLRDRRRTSCIRGCLFAHASMREFSLATLQACGLCGPMICQRSAVVGATSSWSSHFRAFPKVFVGKATTTSNTAPHHRVYQDTYFILLTQPSAWGHLSVFILLLALHGQLHKISLH